MKQFELQTPISQLFNALKSHIFLRVSIFQIGCSEQSNKTHNCRKFIFVTWHFRTLLGSWFVQTSRISHANEKIVMCDLWTLVRRSWCVNCEHQWEDRDVVSVNISEKIVMCDLWTLVRRSWCVNTSEKIVMCDPWTPVRRSWSVICEQQWEERDVRRSLCVICLPLVRRSWCVIWVWVCSTVKNYLADVSSVSPASNIPHPIGLVNWFWGPQIH